MPSQTQKKQTQFKPKQTQFQAGSESQAKQKIYLQTTDAPISYKNYLTFYSILLKIPLLRFTA